MNDQASALYAEREQRFNDIVALKKPDRIPVIPLVTHYFPTKIKGVSNRDAGYDHALRYRCMKEAVLEFGWDFAAANGIFPSQSLEALGVKQVTWPGGDSSGRRSVPVRRGRVPAGGGVRRLSRRPERLHDCGPYSRGSPASSRVWGRSRFRRRTGSPIRTT